MVYDTPLHIYRASAGSGKTFLLASEYLCLLFEYPTKYREILAVTFTNKATEEMKERILGELKKIAQGEESPYVTVILNRIHKIKNRLELQHTADQLYRTIIHDYAKFSVTTIDSFVQQVVRSFAFEIGLDAGFELQLNQDAVKEDLADRLFALLETNQDLLNWVKTVALDRIEAGQNWDFRSDLLSLAGEIFQERFYRFEQHMRELEEPNKAFEQLKKSLMTLRREVEENMKSIGKKATELIGAKGLAPADFSYGNGGVAGYFFKIQEGKYEAGVRTLECLDNPTKWTAAKVPADLKERVQSVYPSLNKLLHEALEYYGGMALDYQTALAILRKLNNLSLLRVLADQLAEYRRDNNVLLISDTQQLLRELVKDNEAPFIYEKIGNRYQHFLLDEFQDTSRFQWENFKPLIEESVSVGAFNLVVGDVKQSIYRWRNGDWRLLQQQVKEDIGAALVKEASLQDNYRSRKNIIDFNNTLFKTAPTLLQQDFVQEMSAVTDESILQRLQQQQYFEIIEKAYADAVQQKPQHCEEGGLIDVRFYEKQDSRSPNSWKPEAEERLCELIDELLTDRALKPGQITILTRNNADARRVIDLLLHYQQTEKARAKDYNLISSDALLISASPAVQLVMAAFRYLLNEKDDIARVELVQANAIRINDAKRTEEKATISDPQLYRREITHQLSLLPEAFFKNKDRLLQLSLYEATEQIIACFELDLWEKQQAFLLAFRDLVNSFSNKGKPSVRDFVLWWTEEGCLKALPLASSEKAIQVMTIHKSKGLAFDVVILPFADWKLKSDKGILWCEWPDSPSGLQILPVDIQSALAKTRFAFDYFEEMLMSRMDALNMLYVALTRARQAIYMMAPQPSKKSSEEKTMSTIGDLLYASLGRQQHYQVDGLLHSAQSSKDDETNQLRIPLQKGTLRHLQALREALDGEQLMLPRTNEQQKIGRLTHLVLSRIKTADQLNEELERMQLEGLLNSQEKTQVQQTAQSALSHPQLAGWLRGEYNILNEKAILLPGGHIRRPDKIFAGREETILLDFKFTQETSPSHARQLEEYRDLLQKMGYPSVQAYVYYGYNQSIVPLQNLVRNHFQQGKLFG